MRTETQILAELQELNVQVRALNQELETVRRKARVSSSSSYERRKVFLDGAAPILAHALKPGDYVKVMGSRSTPYRMIKEISPSTLIGVTCSLNPKTKMIYRVNEYDIITCGTNKIIEILRDGRWIKTKEFLNMKKETK